jgi:hypothetical protein
MENPPQTLLPFATTGFRKEAVQIEEKEPQIQTPQSGRRARGSTDGTTSLVVQPSGFLFLSFNLDAIWNMPYNICEGADRRSVVEGKR